MSKTKQTKSSLLDDYGFSSSDYPFFPNMESSVTSSQPIFASESNDLDIYTEIARSRSRERKTKNELMGVIESLQKDVFKKLKETEDNNKTTTWLLDRLQKESKEEKISFITFSGIFVAIFTFLSIQINLIQSTSGIGRVAGLVTLTVGLLLGFVLLLDQIAKSDKEITMESLKRSWKFYILTIILIITGAVMIFVGDSKFNSDLEDRLIQLEELDTVPTGYIPYLIDNNKDINIDAEIKLDNSPISEDE